MRKLTDVTGLKLGPGMEEALNRMEAGEDPEQVEADRITSYNVCYTKLLRFILDKTIGLRVEKEDEIMGLDTTQHSESAYN